MGLVLKIVSGGTPVKVEVDAGGDIFFPKYDIEYDVAMAEFGEEPTEACLFYSTWRDSGLPGILGTKNFDEKLRMVLHGWVRSFLNAVKRQGLNAFAADTQSQADVMQAIVSMSEKVLYEDGGAALIKQAVKLFGAETFCKAVALRLRFLIGEGAKIWGTPTLIRKYADRNRVKLDVVSHRRFFSRKFASETNLIKYRLSIYDVVVAEWINKLRRLIRHPLHVGDVFYVAREDKRILRDEDKSPALIGDILIDLKLWDYRKDRDYENEVLKKTMSEVPKESEHGDFKVLIFEPYGYAKKETGEGYEKKYFEVDKNFETIEEASAYIEIVRSINRRDYGLGERHRRRQWAYILKRRESPTMDWELPDVVIELEWFYKLLERWEVIGATRKLYA